MCTNNDCATVRSGIQWATFGAYPDEYRKGKVSVVFELPCVVYGILDYGFAGWADLEFISLPTSVINIMQRAFLNCTSLRSLTIPDNVMRIGVSAFMGNVALSSVVFGEASSLTVVGESAFRDCTSLQISLPSGASVGPLALFNMKDCLGWDCLFPPVSSTDTTVSTIIIEPPFDTSTISTDLATGASEPEYYYWAILAAAIAVGCFLWMVMRPKSSQTTLPDAGESPDENIDPNGLYSDVLPSMFDSEYDGGFPFYEVGNIQHTYELPLERDFNAELDI